MLILLIIGFASLLVTPMDLGAKLSPLLTCVIAGVATYFLGRKWNAPRWSINKNTGKEVFWKPNHSLYWLPMQYWGIIEIILGVLFYINN